MHDTVQMNAIHRTERSCAFTECEFGGAGRFFRSYGAGIFSAYLPTACAVSCILSPLRGWDRIGCGRDRYFFNQP